MTDPRLAAELHIQNPADTYRTQPAANSMSNNAASDPSGYARSVVQDGRVVSTENGKSQRSSTDALAIEANTAERTPYIRAVDGRNSQPLTPSQLKDDSILTFPDGSQVSVSQARALGWLATPASAPPQPTSGAPNRPFNEGQEPPKSEVHPDLKADLLADEALDRDYSNLVDTTGGVEQQQAIQQVVEKGEIDERTLGTLATQLGVEPEQLQGRVAPIMEAFKTQAMEVLSGDIEGLDGMDVVRWAQQHKPDAFNRAQHRQGTMRQTGGYAELRTEYLESLAEHSPEVALKADLGSGITQSRDTKGRIIVRLADGATMEWKTALRAFGIRKN